MIPPFCLDSAGVEEVKRVPRKVSGVNIWGATVSLAQSETAGDSLDGRMQNK